MRQTQVFSGSSYPELVNSICERLGSSPAQAELGKFSNGETKVNLNTSIRDQDVFIVQSGSNKINDDIMELLIMISACKSGSAKSVTAVMPYFPYSRQSKKKSHRGSITARMIANLLHNAGTNHVITIDLHASQMQGFFHCPVDNLVAEPLLARWIKTNVRDWSRAVVVSKNPGGTKRVTSLADRLKLNFGIVMTDRKRPGSARASMATSMILERPHVNGVNGDSAAHRVASPPPMSQLEGADDDEDSREPHSRSTPVRPSTPRRRTGHEQLHSPLSQSHTPESPTTSLNRAQTAPSTARDQLDGPNDDEDDEADPRNRDIVTGRLVHGRIVDDEEDGDSPASTSGSTHDHLADDESPPDQMFSSFHTSASNLRASTYGANAAGLGGSGDAHASSDDEEENLRNDLESTVTLVGNVKRRPVFILDDMIDKSASWIAAAETVVKRGGATSVYCFATHGLFGGDALQEMEECDSIDMIIVTNAFPIPQDKLTTGSTKLRVLDVSYLLAEAIRRNHNGETIEQLMLHSMYD